MAGMFGGGKVKMPPAPKVQPLRPAQEDINRQRDLAMTDIYGRKGRQNTIMTQQLGDDSGDVLGA